MDNIIMELKRIRKSANGKIILKDINLSLYKGQTLTILGKNGQGKSTLLKLIAGFIAPTSGERNILEKDLRISYVPERFPKLNFTANEYLMLMGEIYGLKQDDIKNSLSKLYEEFEIESMANLKIRDLSKGSAQKIAIIHALLINCPLLILDEPLTGQDSMSQSTFIKLVTNLKKKGVTILLAAHELHLIESVSDRIVIIEKGQISDYQGEESSNKPLMQVQLKNMNDKATEIIRYMEGVVNVEIHRQILNVVAEKDRCDDVVLTAIKNGLSVISLNEIRE